MDLTCVFRTRGKGWWWRLSEFPAKFPSNAQDSAHLFTTSTSAGEKTDRFLGRNHTSPPKQSFSYEGPGGATRRKKHCRNLPLQRLVCVSIHFEKKSPYNEFPPSHLTTPPTKSYILPFPSIPIRHRALGTAFESN